MFVIFYIYQSVSWKKIPIFFSASRHIDHMKIILTHKLNSDTPTQKSFHKARFLYKYIETQTRTVKFFFLKIF